MALSACEAFVGAMGRVVFLPWMRELRGFLAFVVRATVGILVLLLVSE